MLRRRGPLGTSGAPAGAQHAARRDRDAERRAALRHAQARRRLDARVGTVLPPPRRPARGPSARRAAVAALAGVAALAVVAALTGAAARSQVEDPAPPVTAAGDAPGAAAPGAAPQAGAPQAAAPDRAAAPPAGPPAGRAAQGRPVTLAFAGDINTVGGAGEAVRAGLPSIRGVLQRADVAVVNLETAVTERGTAAAKTFTFRSPASTLVRLQEAGVDVATVANNHGLDYGQQGLRDTLATSSSVGLPLVGLGLDEDQAYAPHVVTVHGQRIAVLGATQVLDGDVQEAWTAGPGKPGLASAKREARLLQEVERAREQADTVVVYLHWGRERDPCPLPRQQELARQLVDAGADVVVGTHAHVLLGGGYLDGAYVDYGLGNFAFDARSEEGARTGVLTLTVQGRAVTDAVWVPAVVRAGAPQPLSGEAARRAVDDKDRRRSCTGLAAAP